MKLGRFLLAALGLTAATVWAPTGLAQETAADEPPTTGAQSGGSERGTSSQAASRPTVGQSRMTSTEFPLVRGQVLLRQTGANATAVIVTVMGLEPGSTHVNHIHGGSCTGSILLPLTDLVADESGIARSISSVPAALNVENWWVNVHAGASLPSPGITCGKVDGPPARPARSNDGPGPRPEGGDRPSAPPAGAPPAAPERR